MHQIIQTDVYSQWFESLRDRQARARINARVRRLSLGSFGDIKSLRGGVSELRIDYGPGYRIYITLRKQEIVVLLAGGDKRTQARDIEMAIRLARELEV